MRSFQEVPFANPCSKATALAEGKPKKYPQHTSKANSWKFGPDKIPRSRTNEKLVVDVGVGVSCKVVGKGSYVGLMVDKW